MIFQEYHLQAVSALIWNITKSGYHHYECDNIIHETMPLMQK